MSRLEELGGRGLLPLLLAGDEADQAESVASAIDGATLLAGKGAAECLELYAQIIAALDARCGALHAAVNLLTNFGAREES